MMEYLAKGETYNFAYYCTLLRCLIKEIKEKRSGLLTTKVLFQQENALVHTAVLIRDYRLELLPHPVYLPDLAPSGLSSVLKPF